MFKTVDYDSLEGKYILIDVRSPGEFKEATIPGAVNVPLFDDEDRKNIGTVYVNESVEKAKKLGVEAAARKLPEIYERVSSLDKDYDKLVFFCARGGMRSSSICALTNSLGVNALKLSGGYKGYREFINRELPKANKGVKYIVIHGKTGVGKTEILKCLQSRGNDVLDLEGAANHRGSLLGNVGLGECRSQKQFESFVFETLGNRKTDYVFVEGESKRIGNIIIPQYIYESMENGLHILVDADLNFRASLTIDEYTKGEDFKEEILKSFDKMSRYISEKNMNIYRSLLEEGKYEEVTKELMTKYYDPMYMNQLKNYQYDLTVEVKDIEETCIAIENWLNKIKC